MQNIISGVIIEAVESKEAGICGVRAIDFVNSAQETVLCV
jgi:hypothetical protein